MKRLLATCLAITITVVAAGVRQQRDSKSSANTTTRGTSSEVGDRHAAHPPRVRRVEGSACRLHQANGLQDQARATR